MDFIEGEILYIDKPLHWTSFRVVRVVRAKICRRLGIKKLKVGHAGTLDPLATGVMILCTGRKTKLIEALQAETKEYIAHVRLGATTPSFDLETEIDAEYPTTHITRKMVEDVLRRFTGTIEQVPPVFSAVKVDGKRAYELARKNKDIELKPKLLVIDDIELISYNMPDITIRVVCSKGTYIRALARDIGIALDSGAHLTGLRRTRVGDITVDNCLNMDDIDHFFNENIPQVTQENR
ncbi:tRNA pseudouridine55 synthase [Porphyromonadaceae bacterium NLAE-zl-C104]|jgi:tRNA pseudouridine55 synthase|uniref:tRNA pseudouridine(55) synthase TruB n=1 Tax=Proteiniphilum saccharofermentans TaxID=1642647 RepID=UPI00089A90E9|nr:tRNA pseudouridine(55) synthase TruB [Proteiniphilum saccharofermentans]SEA21576.1 tRNA pseudouridine55 synthase [Porphyromonadaceae bacterium KH3R12]SFS49987.1 tRNA pseudouridine55 synthase [Porphyromonadaceae bacterium NLAE-zl-C104]